jgi:hypothetical protein
MSFDAASSIGVSDTDRFNAANAAAALSFGSFDKTDLKAEVSSDRIQSIVLGSKANIYRLMFVRLILCLCRH